MEKKNTIFNFIYPYDNDLLKDLSGEDLQILLVLLDEYKLKLRKDTNIPKDVTFGIEIEVENLKDSKSQEIYDNLPDEEWKVTNDLSLRKGIEVVSPILIDEKKTWKEISKICKYLKTISEISSNTAGHIHVGAQIMEDDTNKWLNLLKLWSVYENIIFRFSNGEYINSRMSQQRFAPAVKEQLEKEYDILKKCGYDVTNTLRILQHDRNQAINFENIYLDRYNEFYKNNTIEIRCPNGTLNPIIWQNNINFFTKFLLYCNDNAFDYDTVLKREEKNNKNKVNYTKYETIYLEQALELADLLFNNNKDKVYFLRQYLKSFEIDKSYNSALKKAKVFTK